MSKTATAAAKKTTKKSIKIVTKGPDRTHKICSVCKTAQPLDMFDRPAKDCRCKGCGAAYAKALKQRKAEALAQAEAAKPAAKKAAKKTTPETITVAKAKKAA